MPKCYDESGSGGKSLRMDHAYALHSRRRLGSRMWARRTARDTAAVFLGTISAIGQNDHRVGRSLPPEVCRIIATFVESSWNACEHNWRPCLRCRKRRCSLCGARFMAPLRDPRACACVLGTRRSLRLMQRRERTWLSDSGFPRLRPLHAEYPEIYPDSD